MFVSSFAIIVIKKTTDMKKKMSMIFIMKEIMIYYSVHCLMEVKIDHYYDVELMRISFVMVVIRMYTAVIQMTFQLVCLVLNKKKEKEVSDSVFVEKEKVFNLE
ncbi:MAG: hypothetical protein EZS28_045674 [Streblomastix strix]|uniref:Uncharacterized protein n=1 Tax=Streblomastix strix TaxID=222440 RepID=A0A5J4TKK3_9EUKA|nr:MAG: hypothetical protein EZS28_045674 [Streblomastix strix]